MDHQEFKRILTAFADAPTDLDLSRGKLLLQLHDEVVEVEVFMREGTLCVRENDEEMSARKWLLSRVARLSQLADRILTFIPKEPYFVTPSGELTDQPSASAGMESQPISDAAGTVLQVLDRRPAAMTTVLYLTSDAGEGKTTLINCMARTQANAYKEKSSDWLLVPISLGGRSFLRFDDVVVATLVNRLRFQFLYYDAFVELVRLGTIVPAFDGFEEMFVESSSGEALSALGNLMRTLSSSGSVLIAARKAYFEYKSFETNAKLFDTIGQDVVEFARLGINRWDKTHFLQYCERRNIANAETIYSDVLNRFDVNHPLLTRAVLVRHLLDLATSTADRTSLIDRLGESPHDYFFRFVNTIIEREANEKWIDRSGEPHVPLLTVAEHLELLSSIAEEMWNNSVDSLAAEYVDVLADLFSDSKKKNANVGRQVKERLKQHALIVGRDNGKTFAFDHEEFRNFFLGEAIGRLLGGAKKAELLRVLSRGPLPGQAAKAAIARMRRKAGIDGKAMTLLQEVSASDGPASFTRENCGALLAAMLTGLSAPVSVSQIFFPSDALYGCSLQSVEFEDCEFQPSSLEHARLRSCKFIGCRLERLDFYASTVLEDVRLEATSVACVTSAATDSEIFDPIEIARFLTESGVSFHSEKAVAAPKPAKPEDEFKLTERLLRYFLRTTQINENMIRLKLGDRANSYIANTIPKLLESGVLYEVDNRGSGAARHFRLGVPMNLITDALSRAGGKLTAFLDLLRTAPVPA